MFQVSRKTSGKENSKQKPTRNEYRKPIAFRFSKFAPSSKGSFSKAKMEIRELYPLVANVSFFQLRKNSEILSGWMNFKNPKDCALTYDLVKNCPQNGIVVDKMGDCQAADFKESLTTPKCQFRKKMVPLQNFSENVDQTELNLLKPKAFVERRLIVVVWYIFVNFFLERN